MFLFVRVSYVERRDNLKIYAWRPLSCARQILCAPIPRSKLHISCVFLSLPASRVWLVYHAIYLTSYIKEEKETGFVVIFVAAVEDGP